MQYRNLGAAGVKVSSLCLGAMTFGEADEKSFMHKVGSDEATSHAVLDRALASGINFIDTADVYGQDGLSERVLGNWLTARGTRDKIVLASKFRFTMGEGANRSGASRYRIVKCVEDSLRRLRTDRIDLYQIHMQDITTPEDETLRALDDLVSAGKVLYIGCSNYAAYRLMNSLWLSRTQNLVKFVTLQAQYSLIARELEREHVPLCRETGLGILPWSPLAGGFLTGNGEFPPVDFCGHQVFGRLQLPLGFAKTFRQHCQLLPCILNAVVQAGDCPPLLGELFVSHRSICAGLHITHRQRLVIGLSGFLCQPVAVRLQFGGRQVFDVFQ